jgi:hypothetical protein
LSEQQAVFLQCQPSTKNHNASLSSSSDYPMQNNLTSIEILRELKTGQRLSCHPLEHSTAHQGATYGRKPK